MGGLSAQRPGGVGWKAGAKREQSSVEGWKTGDKYEYKQGEEVRYPERVETGQVGGD